MKKKKSNNNISTIDLYDNNLVRLMNISKFIDEENDYPIETQNDSVFIKLLFQDIRKCSKWYSDKEYRPIKTAIHNCYKLVQKGYVPDNQGELENNIQILEKLIKDQNSKKSRLEKISEEVVQNIFDKTIKNLSNLDDKKYEEDVKDVSFNNNNNNNNNIIQNNNSDYVTKEKMEEMLNEQKNYYESKMTAMQNQINSLESKVNELTNLMTNMGKCFNMFNQNTNK